MNIYIYFWFGSRYELVTCIQAILHFEHVTISLLNEYNCVLFLFELAKNYYLVFGLLSYIVFCVCVNSCTFCFRGKECVCLSL